MAPLSLTVEAVSHRHPGAGRHTPQAVSFALAAGERALLVGPNGAGKTTLLLRIVGLVDGPGTVRIGGEEMSGRGGQARRLRRGIGFLWQSPDDALLLPTVVEDVALGLINDGERPEAARARARDWLERLGIAGLAEREVRALSLGEKQLVALAGVLVREPGLLLLDEPTSALDEEHRARLGEILAGLDATMLMVSHDPDRWTSRGFGRRVVVSAG